MNRLALVGCLALCDVAAAQESRKLDFSYVLKDLTFANFVEPSDSTQNPDNVLEIPSFQLESELRLDLFLDYGPLELTAKPRLNVHWERWTEAPRADVSDADAEFFVNEFRASVTPDQRWFFSYGRENLQWGPSALISPSNPFFIDNGQRNPKREVRGSDFAQVVWIPNQTLTWSVMANLFAGERLGSDRGRELESDFERTYAVKGDFTFFQKYFSVIASYREAGENERGGALSPSSARRPLSEFRIGAYAGWTVSEALLLHAEASGRFRNNALYPSEDPTSPWGLTMQPLADEDAGFGGLFLAGGSYTFGIGPTLQVEYLFNSEGYREGEAESYYRLRASAAHDLSAPPPLSDLAAVTLFKTLNPGLRLLRRNYVMLQYQQAQIRNLVDVFVRYTIGVDDASSQLIPVVQYGVSDRVNLFLIGNHNFGASDSEARFLVDYVYQVGFDLTF